MSVFSLDFHIKITYKSVACRKFRLINHFVFITKIFLKSERKTGNNWHFRKDALNAIYTKKNKKNERRRNYRYF